VKLELEMTSAAAPLQLEGTIDGHHVYFRERHDAWRLELDDHVIATGNVRVTVEQALTIILNELNIGQQLFDKHWKSLDEAYEAYERTQS
jgi:hypothetical protein